MEDAPEDDEREVAREEHRALGWTALVAALVILWIAMPVGVGILLGTLLAFMAQPLFERLRPALGARGSALATVMIYGLAVTGLLGGLGWLFVARGTVLSRQLIASFEPGGFASDVLGAAGRLTDRFGISADELASHARNLADSAARSATDVAQVIAATTANALLALFFAMLALHYILRNWQDVSLRASESFPLRPDYTAALFAEFRRVGRTTLLGAVGTGLVQGVLATIGFAMSGVPEPIFFGALTAVASFIPAVGTLLVLIPVGVILLLADHPVAGIFELIWGLVMVVAISDYVIRPALIRGEDKVPSLVTFASLFGGVEAFGLKGLIIGPVLMALSIAVLRLYAAETRKRRHLESLDRTPVQELSAHGELGTLEP